MLHTTGARLAAAMLGYFAFLIVLLTLDPFYFELPAQIQIDLRVRPSDIIENVILFLPLGFLYRLTGGSRRGAIILGAALSLGVETAQLFVPVRTTSPMDFMSNTLGAWLGAWLHDRLAARIAMTPTMVGRLALETPLMGLLYMLVPLLWMNTLALNVMSNRWVLTVLLGVCGAIILSDIYREWEGHVGIWSTGRVALAAAVWFLLGSGPRLLRPMPTVPITIGVALLTAILATLPWHAKKRRFERITLSRVLPGLMLYIFLVALWPLVRPLTPWHGTLGMTDHIEAVNTRYPAPLLEYLAAFTVFGYVIAEWRGRAEVPLARDVPRLLLVALGSALALELLIGFQAGHGASLTRLILVVGGALFGGSIYHLQRDHVRFLVKTPAVRGPRSSKP
ncbi:MAG: VanZ family protein [Chloroflexales bacterium]